ncbi:MAG TPA: hypothetical protein VKA27_06780 [Sunxiuqinia sp.]|nr:hypothetical protein [Sunxiuqinia sp.]
MRRSGKVEKMDIAEDGRREESQLAEALTGCREFRFAIEKTANRNSPHPSTNGAQAIAQGEAL